MSEGLPDNATGRTLPGRRVAGCHPMARSRASSSSTGTTRATALRSRAEALQKEELALRERYGLKR